MDVVFERESESEWRCPLVDADHRQIDRLAFNSNALGAMPAGTFPIIKLRSSRQRPRVN
jgi:hypothetical protein